MTRRTSISSVLVLVNIPATGQVGIGHRLEVLQLGVDGCELWSLKNPFCCFERDSSTTVAKFVLTSAMDSCFVSTSVTCWRHSEEIRWSGGERSYK